MAEEKEVIKIEIEGGENIQKAKNSLSELKAELKAAKAAALNGDGAAAKRIAELTDKMDDLRDSTKSLQGSGIERLKNSFGLLTDGFKNFDGDKIKTAFKGIGTAMSAIPLILIIEGVKYLVENFDELSKGSGVLATTLRALGDAFTAVKDFITDSVGATDDYTRALEKQGEAIKTNSDELNAALNSQIAAFDRQIAVAKASGKSTVELEQAKQQAIIDTNLAVARQIQAFVEAGGEFDDEKKKLLTASLEAIKGAKVQEYVIEQNDLKGKTDLYKKHLDEKKKSSDELDAYNKKRAEDESNAEELQAQAAIDRDNAATQAKINNAVYTQEQIDAINAAASAKEYENSLKSIELNKERLSNELAATQQGLEGAQALSDIFFLIKSNKNKQAGKEDEAQAKKQFEVNKAFQIANATIQGAQAVLGAYSSGAALPVIGAIAGPLYAAAAGLVAIRNIAQIKATQFKGGSAGASSTPTTPTLPSANTNVPTINPANNNNTTTFTGNVNNNVPTTPTKVFVTEGDIRRSSERVDRLIDQATY